MSNLIHRRTQLQQLRNAKPVILPSMLLCDFSNLQREVTMLEEAGAKAFHLDVMDGCFVPNLTYGMPIVEAFRKLTNLPIDVHLMIVNPENYVQQFCDAGADIITFHIEATDDPEPILHQLKQLGVGVGLAANPHTPVSRLEPYLPECDLALIMSVDAGFGGQKFNASALEKLAHVRKRFGDELLLEVDGGINKDTVSQCAQAGADLFVVGSGIFKAGQYGPAIQHLTDLASTGAN